MSGKQARAKGPYKLVYGWEVGGKVYPKSAKQWRDYKNGAYPAYVPLGQREYRTDGEGGALGPKFLSDTMYRGKTLFWQDSERDGWDKFHKSGKLDEWLFDCPSFEVWLNALCYESGKGNGGQTFQKLMALLLSTPFNSGPLSKEMQKEVPQYKDYPDADYYLPGQVLSKRSDKWWWKTEKQCEAAFKKTTGHPLPSYHFVKNKDFEGANKRPDKVVKQQPNWRYDVNLHSTSASKDPIGGPMEMNVPLSFAKCKFPGMPIGQISNNARGWVLTNTQGQPVESRLNETHPKSIDSDLGTQAQAAKSNAHALPGSRFDFMASAGNKLWTSWGDKQCVAHTSNAGRAMYQSAAGAAKYTSAAAAYKKHCPSLGEVLAAYIGLYFYPGCEDGANNKTVEVDGYKIRMRRPNPLYVRHVNNGRFQLSVTEKMHRLDTENGYWMQPPDLQWENFECHVQIVNVGHNEPPNTPWDRLITQAPKDAGKPVEEMQMQMCPWCGPCIRQPSYQAKRLYFRTNHADPMDSYNQLTALFAKSWQARWHGGTVRLSNTDDLDEDAYNKELEKTFFGWNQVHATLLWPHAPARGKKATRKYTGFLEFPKWRTDVAAALQMANKGTWRFPPINVKPLLLALSLELPPADISEYALNSKFKTLKYDYKSFRARFMPDLAPTAQVEEEEEVQEEVQPRRRRRAPVEEVQEEQEPRQQTSPDDVDGAENPNFEDDAVDDDVAAEKERLQAQSQPPGEDERCVQCILGEENGDDGDRPQGEQKITPLKPRTPKVTNRVFKFLHSAPWHPDDLYTKPEMHFVQEAMSDEEKIDYEKKYGSLANALVGHTKPKKIVGVENNFGLPRVVKDRLLHEYPITAGYMNQKEHKLPALSNDLKAMFNRNFDRILRIYMDDSCTEKGHPCQLKVKQALFVKKWAWNPVFTPAFAAYVADLRGTEFLLTNEDVKRIWDVYEYKEPVLTEWPRRVNKQSMTVGEWITTPWHYHYLPFETVNSLFDNNEGYSCACKRCSRMFYEYETKYSPYEHTINGAKHFQFAYWKVPHKPRKGEKAEVVEQGVKYSNLPAPLPFHDPKLWYSEPLPQVAANTHVGADPIPGLSLTPWHAVERNQPGRAIVTAAAPPGGTQTQEVSGYGLWPLRLFLLGFDTNGNAETPRAQQKGVSPLHHEFEKRCRDGRYTEFCDSHQNGYGAVYREYSNHAYVEGLQQHALIKQGYYSKGKVKMGMWDYKLQRANKYSNVCRDCESFLTKHGLLQRSTFTQAYDAKKAKKLRKSDQYWLRFFEPREENEPYVPKTVSITWEGKQVELTFNVMWLFLQVPRDNRGWRYQRTTTATERRLMGSQNDFVKKLKLLDELDKHTLEWYGTASTRDALKELFGRNWQAEHEKHLEAVKVVDNKHVEYSGPSKVVRQDVQRQVNLHLDTEKLQLMIDRGAKHVSAIVDACDTYLGRGEAPTLELQLEVESADEVRALRDMLKGKAVEEARVSMGIVNKTPMYDPEQYRIENRACECEFCKKWRSGAKPLHTYELVKPDKVLDALSDFGYEGAKPDNFAGQKRQEIYDRNYRQTIYTGSAVYRKEPGEEYKQVDKFGYWEGDAAIGQQPKVQNRQRTQSRVLLTYVLHRRITSDLECRLVLEKMADAVRELFGKDRWLSEILIFGKKLKVNVVDDALSKAAYVRIEKPRKEGKEFFYASSTSSSYEHDTYQTHIDSIDVMAGVEIGPTYSLPHFHLLLTVNHYSYVQVETSRMREILERMFKGLPPFAATATDPAPFELRDGMGERFYTDNEQPYMDIRMYPTDNWAQVIAAYVRKTATSDQFAAQRMRAGV